VEMVSRVNLSCVYFIIADYPQFNFQSILLSSIPILPLSRIYVLSPVCYL